MVYNYYSNQKGYSDTAKERDKHNIFRLSRSVVNIGVSPSGKATDFDSVITLVRSQPPQPQQGI